MQQNPITITSSDNTELRQVVKKLVDTIAEEAKTHTCTTDQQIAESVLLKLAGKRLESEKFSRPIIHLDKQPHKESQDYVTMSYDESESLPQNDQCKDNSRNGRWTKEEHKKFVEALSKFGKNWKKVEEYVGTRSGTQVRSHAQKYFLKVDPHIYDTPSKNNENDSDSATPTVITGLCPEKPELELAPEQRKMNSNMSLLNAKLPIISDTQPKSIIPSKEMIPKIEQIENYLKSALNRLKIITESPGNTQKNYISLRQEFFDINQNTLILLGEYKENPLVCDRCSKIIEAVNFGLSEIARNMDRMSQSVNKLPSEVQCKYLLKLLAPYGFYTLEQIESKFVKLNDWVDTSSKFHNFPAQSSFSVIQHTSHM